jgi:hypothetical protein
MTQIMHYFYIDVLLRLYFYKESKHPKFSMIQYNCKKIIRTIRFFKLRASKKPEVEILIKIKK